MTRMRKRAKDDRLTQPNALRYLNGHENAQFFQFGSIGGEWCICKRVWGCSGGKRSEVVVLELVEGAGGV